MWQKQHYWKEQALLRESLRFYLKFVGSVEVQRAGKLTSVYFRVPFLSAFLTQNIQHSLEKESLSNNIQSRLLRLITFSQYFQYEMSYQQRISHWPILRLSLRVSQISRVLLFYIVLAINVLLILDLAVVDVDVDVDNNNPTAPYENRKAELSDAINSIFTMLYVVHILIALKVTVCEMIERYPVLAYYRNTIGADFAGDTTTGSLSSSSNSAANSARHEQDHEGRPSTSRRKTTDEDNDYEDGEEDKEGASGRTTGAASIIIIGQRRAGGAA